MLAKLSNKGLLGIALVLSFATAALVYNLLSSTTQKPPPTVGETVVVAKTDIPPKTRITQDMVQEIQLPSEYVQKAAMRELSKVLGVMTREAIVGGEQVLARRLLIEGKQAGFTGVIPPGKRALTVAVSDVTGVSGLLKAGDYVDVLVTFDQQVVGDHVSQILLQNLLVLAVNRDSEVAQERDAKKEAGKETGIVKVATVTLAVSPSEAAKVTLSEEKGKLRFALRPYIPEEGVVDKRPVTPTEIVGVHQSPVQAAQTPPVTPPAGGGAAAAAAPANKSLTTIPVIRGTKIE